MSDTTPIGSKKITGHRFELAHPDRGFLGTADVRAQAFERARDLLLREPSLLAVTVEDRHSKLGAPEAWRCTLPQLPRPIRWKGKVASSPAVRATALSPAQRRMLGAAAAHPSGRLAPGRLSTAQALVVRGLLAWEIVPDDEDRAPDLLLTAQGREVLLAAERR